MFPPDWAANAVTSACSRVAAVLFHGNGFALYGHLARHQLYYVVFAVGTARLILGPIWLADPRFGPVE